MDSIASRMKDPVVLERPVLEEALVILRAIATGRQVAVKEAEAKRAVLQLVASVARSDEELRMFPERPEDQVPGRSVVSIRQAVVAGGRGLVAPGGVE